MTQDKINRMFAQNLKQFINRWMVSEISIMKEQMLKRVNNFGLIYRIMRKNTKQIQNG